MQSLPDFADNYFCLPPLDILIAAAPDAGIGRVAQALERECHKVTVVKQLSNAFADADALAPDVLLVDASTAEGVALARRVRARFGERIVLLGLAAEPLPAALVRVFDYLLPKPVEYIALACALGLIPEPPDAAGLAAVAIAPDFESRGLRQAA